METKANKAPVLTGLKHLGSQPIIFRDRRNGRSEEFTIHHYRDEKTGELVLAAEEKYEDILDEMIAAGVFN